MDEEVELVSSDDDEEDEVPEVSEEPQEPEQKVLVMKKIQTDEEWFSQVSFCFFLPQKINNVTSVVEVGLNTKKLDPYPEFWTNLDPDPGLCYQYQFVKKNLKIIVGKNYFLIF